MGKGRVAGLKSCVGLRRIRPRGEYIIDVGDIVVGVPIINIFSTLTTIINVDTVVTDIVADVDRVMPV